MQYDFKFCSFFVSGMCCDDFRVYRSQPEQVFMFSKIKQVIPHFYFYFGQCSYYGLVRIIPVRVENKILCAHRLSIVYTLLYSILVVNGNSGGCFETTTFDV